MKENPTYNVVLVGYEEGENLGLRSLSAFLKQKGISTLIVPYNPNNKESVLTAVIEAKPVIVGFSLIFQRMLPDFNDLINYLRKHEIKCHFTMGGHCPTVESVTILEVTPGLNSIVRGEGEITLLELFNKLEQPALWPGINGLTYKDNSGRIVVNSPRQLIENLDELPFPEREKISFFHRNFKIATIAASRGCFYNCSFCSIRQFYNQSIGIKRRSRSPENIVNEMAYLYYEMGVQVFIFEDDDFYVNTKSQRQWTLQFIDELEKKKLAGNIAWRMSCRVDDIEREILKKLMDAGLICVYLGIESGNNTNLDIYNKKYGINEIYNAIDILTEINLTFEFGFMLLNPYCSFETLKNDLQFFKRIGSLGSSILQFTKMVPYSGTPIQKRLIDEKKLIGSFSAPDYRYSDPRIDLLESFFHEAFHYRNFNKNGLVELLRFAKFDALLINKLCPNSDTHIYQQQIKQLIKETNQQFIETMSMAINLTESHSLDDIIKYWPILQDLISEEKRHEQKITFLTEKLISNSRIAAHFPNWGSKEGSTYVVSN